MAQTKAKRIATAGIFEVPGSLKQNVAKPVQR